MTDLKNAALTASAVLLAVLILATLVRAVIGPRFTDRVIAVNMRFDRLFFIADAVFIFLIFLLGIIYHPILNVIRAGIRLM